ncbi:glycosyl transferase [Halobacteriales archaeon QS_8_69_26]|nr:MAG: glycosyl transferase [Halobacteriales archaeon QS_8_69_26]
MSSETEAPGAGIDGREDGSESTDGKAPFLPADSETVPTLSVVLPTLNEEAGVRRCLTWIAEAAAELGVPTEVIVSDSSTDRTPDIAREMGAIVVEPDRPGYGYAYRYAFQHVRGEYVAIGDADTTYDFRDLPRLFRPVADGEADIALGSRLAGEIRPGAMPALHRYVGNPLLTAFLNVFYDAGVTDAHSGFRVVSRDALAALRLRSDGMEFASEMIMDAAAKDVRIVEVPITYHERSGEATLHSLRDGWRHVRFMLVNAPGYLFSGPGLAMIGLGILAMTLAVVPVDLMGVDPNVRTMIAGSLLTILGLQATSLAVFTKAAADPIRAPSDPLTTAVATVMTLERGVLVGILVFVAGIASAGLLLQRWLVAGYEALPGLTADVAAFTAIVVGIQTVFFSFFLSAIGDYGTDLPLAERTRDDDGD